MPYWTIYPTHYYFTLVGYPLADSWMPAQLVIYPAPAYAGLNLAAREEITAMQALLDNPGSLSAQERLPFIPLYNATQMFRSQVEWLEFGNGRGARFITMYGQSVNTVSNQELFYTFQGMTNDRRYYVSVILPVTTPILPDSEPEMTLEEWEALSARYQAYLDETALALDALEADAFSPSLAELDRLVQSLTIGDGLVLPETAAAPESDNTATGNLIPIEVAHVQVEVGVGSPIPVTVQVAGTWPGLCTQLATIEQRQGEFWFDITLLAHPDDPDCPADFMGLPFSRALPIKVVELPTGSYTVTVNGISAAFDLPVTP
jgi:hypothetical protein